VHFLFDDSQVPGSSQIYNNHIPLDPDMQGLLSMTKTTPLMNVSRGQLVPYVITYTNITQVPLFDVSIVDRFPAGFHYVAGSARIDDVPAEPLVAGRELIWRDLSVDPSARHTLMVLLAVGAGVSEGEFVNRAQAVYQLTGNALSNEASARVRIVPDPDFDCTDVTGKVFDDANRNGLQDPGERGIGGVRTRRPRQQLRAQARRPHATERLPFLDLHRPGAARDAGQGAELQLRCLGPSGDRARCR
jgi:uncharacterized repeat protein (TIGR01451 family)